MALPSFPPIPIPPIPPICGCSDEFKFFDRSLKQLSRSGHLKPDVHRKFISEVEAKEGVGLDWAKIFSEDEMTYPDAIKRTIKLILEAFDDGKLQGDVHPPTANMMAVMDGHSGQEQVYSALFHPLLIGVVIKALKLILPAVTCPMIKKYRSKVESVLRHFNVTFEQLCHALKCDCE